METSSNGDMVNGGRPTEGFPQFAGPSSVVREAKEPVVVEGSLALDGLADALADVEAPSDALRLILDFVVDATSAASGALLLADSGAFSVAAARSAGGLPSLSAEALLSDPVVTEVLLGKGAIWIPNAAQPEGSGSPQAQRDSRSLLCLPMLLAGRVIAALYLEKRDPTHSFSADTVRELRVLCGMTLPFLVQLRRAAARISAAAVYEIIADPQPMAELQRLLAKVAPTDLTILITGETGTGKEVAARALHRASRRSTEPLVAINCSALPESLLEVELFGCKKGAFSGAHTDRVGLVEAANKGTLFLDEVGDMPLGMQAELLRVVQEREVRRIGETVTRPVDFRLIAATNKDLRAEVKARRFREDLLFRLCEVTLPIPRLADRGDDVIVLARLFLGQAVRELGLPPRSLSRPAELVLLAYRWPGNVRELRSTIRRTAVLCDGPEILPGDLLLEEELLVAAPTSAASLDVPSPGPALPAPAGPGLVFEHVDLPLAEARAKFVESYVAHTMARHDGNRETAARALGISIRSLYRYHS